MVTAPRLLTSLGRASAITALILGAVIVVRLIMGWAILWDWVAIVGIAGVGFLTAVEWLNRGGRDNA